MRALRALVVLSFTTAAFGQSTPADDASPRGPSAVVSADYLVGAAVNADVLEGCTPDGDHDCRTELRARVYRPKNLSGRRPLVVVLHGNHETCGRAYDPQPGGADRPDLPGNPRIDDNCDYTTTGICPANYVTPDGVPSHLGYEYLATRLASYGYVVVSVSANRGINCRNFAPGVNDVWLIRSRGRLVLKHLQLLSECNRNGGTGLPACDALKGHLDFRNVGYLGHSRGGEGVRAAFELYREVGSPWPKRILDPVVVKGVFEIGPTDRQGDLNVDGVAWNVLLPMCDGDVSDEQGLRPYDRALDDTGSAAEQARPSEKSTYSVWGANHNFYNTEWQTRDDIDPLHEVEPLTCGGAGNMALFENSPGSAPQRLTGISSVLAFFRAHVGQSAKIAFDRHFNPLFDTPGTVRDEANVERAYPTRVDRGYTISPAPARTTVFEDFRNPTGTNTYGSANTRGTNLTVVHEDQVVDLDDDVQRAAVISWTAAAVSTFFQTNWAAAAGRGKNASAYVTLDFRVSRRDDAANHDTATTDLSVQLVAADGTFSGAVPMSRYLLRTPLAGPVGLTDEFHPIFQTVRIPLADFGDWSRIKGKLRGVRFTFDRTPTGAIFLANVTLSRRFGSGVNTLTRPTGAAAPSPNAAVRAARADTVRPASEAARAWITDVRLGAVPDAATGEPTVEIAFAGDRRFAARAQGLVSWVGGRAFDRSYYAGGDLYRPVFVLTAGEAATIAAGDPLAITYGYAGTGAWWDGGTFGGP